MDGEGVPAVAEVAGFDGGGVQVFDSAVAGVGEFGGGLLGSEEELEGLAGAADAGGEVVECDLAAFGERFAGEAVVEKALFPSRGRYRSLWAALR